MKWLNEEYEDTNSLYYAECSNCGCHSAYFSKITKNYEFCPFCGEQVEKEEKEVEKTEIEKNINEDNIIELFKDVHIWCMGHDCGECPFYSVDHCKYGTPPCFWNTSPAAINQIKEVINLINRENKIRKIVKRGAKDVL